MSTETPPQNTDSKIGPGGRRPGRKPKETDPKPQKPTETQGPCPDLMGFCIKALSVLRKTPKCGATHLAPYLTLQVHTKPGGRQARLGGRDQGQCLANEAVQGGYASNDLRCVGLSGLRPSKTDAPFDPLLRRFPQSFPG